MADFFDEVGKALSRVIPTIKTVAPTLAAALGGPLAGTAAKLIVGALGMDDGSTPDQIAAAVTGATPEQLATLKKLDLDFRAHMRELDIAEAKLSFDDRHDARARQIAVRDWTPPILGMCVTGGFFGLLGLMAFHDMPTGNVQVMNIMLGSLGAGFTGILAYYFGSSSGSAAKTELLANSIPAK